MNELDYQALDRDELIEQAYFFEGLGQRLQQHLATQELLVVLREELLSTTRLPLAIDFLVGELRHAGTLGPGMARLAHYFRPFQVFVVNEAERDTGRFDLLLAAGILAREARYRAESPGRQGVFLYQFEAICRHRLGYHQGLEAVAADPIFDNDWREWILTIRRQIGLVDLADLMYVRSEHYRREHAQRLAQGRGEVDEPIRPVLFGEKEGKIALASRKKDPLLMFAALQRHLGYPNVPRPHRAEETVDLVPMLQRKIEQLERRIKLVEEEQRGGIDITRFYQRPNRPLSADGDATVASG